MERKIEYQIAFALSRAAEAKSGACFAAWYEVAGKFDDARKALRNGFTDAALRHLKAARRAAAFAEGVK